MRRFAAAWLALGLPLLTGAVLANTPPAAAQAPCDQVYQLGKKFEYKNCAGYPVRISVVWSDPLGVATSAPLICEIPAYDWKYLRPAEAKVRTAKVQTKERISFADPQAECVKAR